MIRQRRMGNFGCFGGRNCGARSKSPFFAGEEAGFFLVGESNKKGTTRVQQRMQVGASAKREFCAVENNRKAVGRDKPRSEVFRLAKRRRNVSNPFLRKRRNGILRAEKPNKKGTTRVPFLFGAPAGIRIPDTLIKSQVLYRLSYRGILVAP